MGYYQLDSGKRIFALVDPAWCNICAGISQVEVNPTKHELQLQIDACASEELAPEELEFFQLSDRPIAEYLGRKRQSLVKLMELVEHRSLPNRCIECGFSDFTLLTDLSTDGEFPNAFAHRGCGGMLRVTDWLHASPAYYFLLDREGNRLNGT